MNHLSYHQKLGSAQHGKQAPYPIGSSSRPKQGTLGLEVNGATIKMAEGATCGGLGSAMWGPVEGPEIDLIRAVKKEAFVGRRIGSIEKACLGRQMVGGFKTPKIKAQQHARTSFGKRRSLFTKLEIQDSEITQMIEQKQHVSLKMADANITKSRIQTLFCGSGSKNGSFGTISNRLHNPAEGLEDTSRNSANDIKCRTDFDVSRIMSTEPNMTDFQETGSDATAKPYIATNSRNYRGPYPGVASNDNRKQAIEQVAAYPQIQAMKVQKRLTDGNHVLQSFRDQKIFFEQNASPKRNINKILNGQRQNYQLDTKEVTFSRNVSTDNAQKYNIHQPLGTQQLKRIVDNEHIQRELEFQRGFRSRKKSMMTDALTRQLKISQMGQADIVILSSENSQNDVSINVKAQAQRHRTPMSTKTQPFDYKHYHQKQFLASQQGNQLKFVVVQSSNNQKVGYNSVMDDYVANDVDSFNMFSPGSVQMHMIPQGTSRPVSQLLIQRKTPHLDKQSSQHSKQRVKISDQPRVQIKQEGVNILMHSRRPKISRQDYHSYADHGSADKRPTTQGYLNNYSLPTTANYNTNDHSITEHQASIHSQGKHQNDQLVKQNTSNMYQTTQYTHDNKSSISVSPRPQQIASNMANNQEAVQLINIEERQQDLQRECFTQQPSQMALSQQMSNTPTPDNIIANIESNPKGIEIIHYNQVQKCFSSGSNQHCNQDATTKSKTANQAGQSTSRETTLEKKVEALKKNITSVLNPLDINQIQQVQDYYTKGNDLHCLSQPDIELFQNRAISSGIVARSFGQFAHQSNLNIIKNQMNVQLTRKIANDYAQRMEINMRRNQIADHKRLQRIQKLQALPLSQDKLADSNVVVEKSPLIQKIKEARDKQDQLSMIKGKLQQEISSKQQQYEGMRGARLNTRQSDICNTESVDLNLHRDDSQRVFDIDKAKIQPMKIKETAVILQQLFPDESEQWINLSVIMCKEKNYLDQFEKQKTDKSQPVQFYQNHLTDLEIEDQTLRSSIMASIQKLLISRDNQQESIQMFNGLVADFNQNQLVKAKDILDMLVKYHEVYKKKPVKIKSKSISKQMLTFNMNQLGKMLQTSMKKAHDKAQLARGNECTGTTEGADQGKLDTINSGEEASKFAQEDSSDYDSDEEFNSGGNQGLTELQLNSKITKIFSFVKTNVRSSFIETKKKQDRVKQLRTKYLKNQNVSDGRLRILHDYVFTAYMLGIRELLQRCLFQDGGTNFASVIKNISGKQAGGIYSNPIALNLGRRLKIPLEDLHNFIIPARTDLSSNIGNHLQRLETRYSMINPRNRKDIPDQDSNQLSPKLMPLIKSDGTLLLTRRTLDGCYPNQIIEFVSDILESRSLVNSIVKSVIIDDINFDPSQLVSILKSFEKEHSANTYLRHLSIGNVSVDQQLIDYILTNLLPKLLSLELFNLKHSSVSQQTRMFLPLHRLVQDYPRPYMRNQMDGIIDLIEHAADSLLDLELSWCNLNLSNFIDLQQCIRQVGINHADRENKGVRTGTLRKLNLSYNPFMQYGEQMTNSIGLDYKKQLQYYRQNNTILSRQNSSSNLKLDGELNSKHLHDDDSSDSDSHDHLDSFSEAFQSLLRSQTMNKLTHLDLSGISALNDVNIMDIIGDLFEYQYCENLLAIHLNDLGINFNENTKDEISDQFRIQSSIKQKLLGKGNLHVAFDVYFEKVRGGIKYKKEQANKMCYVDVLQKTLEHVRGPNGKLKSNNFWLSQQMQLLAEQKANMHAGHLNNNNGIGRNSHNGNLVDRFVLQRKANCVPEMIFNQNPEQDFVKKHRFFQLDHEMGWRQSDNSTGHNHDCCFICEKQRQTLIFYQRDKSTFLNQRGINKGLVEITDKTFLSKLRSEYNLKYSQNLVSLKKMVTPLIFGTVVKDQIMYQIGVKHNNNLSFDRKLRMVRADLYALLSCSTNQEFFKDAKDSIAVKKSLYNFFRGEMNARADQLNSFQHLDGWNHLLHQKCNKNYVHSVKSVNQPDCVLNEMAKPEAPGDGHYVFATYLKPGYHQIMIYDPQIDKAFCQEFIVEFDNCIEIYPELPIVNKQLLTVVLPPVFKKWIRDDIERENTAYYNDTKPFREQGKQSRDNFEPERFLKSEQDIEQCEFILKQNFKYFQTFFQECQTISPRYPEVDQQTFQTHLQSMLSTLNQNAESEDQFQLKEKEVEVQFISATRHDTKTDRSLCRGEMLELMVRIAHIKKRQTKDKSRKNSSLIQSQSKMPLLNMLQSSVAVKQKTQDARNQDNENNTHEYLVKLLQLGLAPFCEQGPIIALRRQIQDDPLVVRELALRLKELKIMFEHFTIRGLFRFESSALRLFEMPGLNSQSSTEPSHFWYPLNPQDLWPAFIHSMMTVLNEITEEDKYQHILLPEFYEFIGRVALKYSALCRDQLHPSIRNNSEQFRHEAVKDFVEKLIQRFKDNFMVGCKSHAVKK